MDEAFVSDPGPAQMARLRPHLGVRAWPAEGGLSPSGVVRLRPERPGRS